MLETELRLSSAGKWDLVELWELLYEAACKIGKIDAFYVGLYNEGAQTISFPYNRDLGGRYWDIADIRPLSTGPTTWVIKNRRTFMLDKTNAEIQHGGQNFGDQTRQSNSAIHAPMQAFGADGERHLLGVISMQAYEHNAYDDITRGVFEWLASRSAEALYHTHDIVEHQELLGQIEKKNKEKDDDIKAQANQFSNVLQDITNRAQHICSLLEKLEGSKDLIADAIDLCNVCIRAQMVNVAEAHELMSSPSPEGESFRFNDPFLRLTRREQEVLVKLASGLTQQEIAQALRCSFDTVKTHVRQIYGKLGVKKRSQAVLMASPFLKYYR